MVQASASTMARNTVLCDEISSPMRPAQHPGLGFGQEYRGHRNQATKAPPNPSGGAFPHPHHRQNNDGIICKSTPVYNAPAAAVSLLASGGGVTCRPPCGWSCRATGGSTPYRWLDLAMRVDQGTEAHLLHTVGRPEPPDERRPNGR
jgi:hypothetical protein